MPQSTTHKLKVFLELIFFNEKLKHGENIFRVNMLDIKKYSLLCFGGNYRTLKDYEKMLIDLEILEKKTDAFAYFNEKKFHDFVELYGKIERKFSK